MKKYIYLVLSISVGCGGNGFTVETANLSNPDSGNAGTGGNTSTSTTDPVAGNSSVNTSSATGGSFTGGNTSIDQATGGSAPSGTGGSAPSGTGGSTCTNGLTLDYIKTTYTCDVSNPIPYNITVLQPPTGAWLIQDPITFSRYWCTNNINRPNCTNTTNGAPFTIYTCNNGICGSPGLPCNPDNTGDLCPGNSCNCTPTTDNPLCTSTCTHSFKSCTKTLTSLSTVADTCTPSSCIPVSTNTPPGRYCVFN
jgi:hypothetical protein